MLLMHIADAIFRQRLVFIVGDTDLAVGDDFPFRDELDGILVRLRDELHRAADIQSMPVEGDRAHRRADFRKGHGE